MTAQMKYCVAVLLMVICAPCVMAFDSNDLIGSAFEWGVDKSYFMLYFQDGNIVALCVGVICAVLFGVFYKRVPYELRVVWITFALTLILIPLILMISGDGYRGVAFVVIFSVYIGLLGLAVLLPILFIYWVVSLVRFKTFEKSCIAVCNLLKKGVGTIPLAYVLAVMVFIVISVVMKEWNLWQCERYVRSRWNDDFTKVPGLMYQWEENHSLQWGAGAKSHYWHYEESCDTVAEEGGWIESDGL